VNYNVDLCFLSLSAYLDFTNKEAEKEAEKRGRKIVNAHYRINSPKRRIEIPKSNGHKFD
jgi:hypothetical protein